MGPNGNGRPQERWYLRLLGEFELTKFSDGSKVALAGRRERIILAHLALCPNFRQSRRKLVELLWGDKAEAPMLDNLRTCLWHLRKALGDIDRRIVSSDGKDIVLDASAFAIDVWALRAHAVQSSSAGLDDAVSLCRGEFLEGLSIESDGFETWRRDEAARIRDQSVQALGRAMKDLAELDKTDAAIEAGLRLLQLEPVCEPALRQLMRLYAQSGRRSAALELYQRLSDTLRTDFGSEPETETTAVFSEVSRGVRQSKRGQPAAISAAHGIAASGMPFGKRPGDVPSYSGLNETQLARLPRKTWIYARNALIAGSLAAALMLTIFAQFLNPTVSITKPPVAAGSVSNVSAQSGAVSSNALAIPVRGGDPQTNGEFLRLRARRLSRESGIVADLESLVARDPAFAPAVGLLARSYSTPVRDHELWSASINETRFHWQMDAEKKQNAAFRALQLDPNEPRSLLVLSSIETARENWIVADDLARQALALDPNDFESLNSYAIFLTVVGRLEEALPVTQHMLALEPFVPVINISASIPLLLSGRNKEAISLLESLPANAVGGFRNEALARAYAAEGRFDEAADQIRAILMTRYGGTGEIIEAAARLMRSAPAAVEPASLPVLPGRLNFIYAYTGAPERMLEYPERVHDTGVGLPALLRFLFDPVSAQLRKTERFKSLVRNMGLVEYWRERGWPDMCRPVGRDDFVCD